MKPKRRIVYIFGECRQSVTKCYKTLARAKNVLLGYSDWIVMREELVGVGLEWKLLKRERARNFTYSKKSKVRLFSAVGG